MSGEEWGQLALSKQGARRSTAPCTPQSARRQGGTGIKTIYRLQLVPCSLARGCFQPTHALVSSSGMPEAGCAYHGMGTPVWRTSSTSPAAPPRAAPGCRTGSARRHHTGWERRSAAWTRGQTTSLKRDCHQLLGAAGVPKGMAGSPPGGDTEEGTPRRGHPATPQGTRWARRCHLPPRLLLKRGSCCPCCREQGQAGRSWLHVRGSCCCPVHARHFRR